jgi:hypothetical protein
MSAIIADWVQFRSNDCSGGDVRVFAGIPNGYRCLSLSSIVVVAFFGLYGESEELADRLVRAEK